MIQLELDTKSGVMPHSCYTPQVGSTISWDAKGKDMKVFISHSSKDKWAARRISQDLNGLGVETFLDEKDIKTGEPIDESIKKHLKECDELLILLSPASIKSDWVLIEIGGAIALEKKLVPILLYIGANEIPQPISKHLARDINELDKYYKEVKENIKSGKPIQPSIVRRRRPIQKLKIKVFKVGDIVQLPFEPPEDAERDGPTIEWQTEMKKYLGKKAKVKDVDNDQSLTIDIDGEEFWWAFEWLEKVN